MQIDGSYHNWLEDRGPWLTLLLAVDDATGTIPYALFAEHEDAEGYFRLLWGIIENRGVPMAIYTDRHAVFQPSRRPSETLEASLSRERGRTQVGQALRELGVCQVFARSPEAKGRVERMAGTFQDRLVSELRLADVKTMADANRVLWEFLPRFNQHFGVPASQPGGVYRSLDPDLDLGAILCFKHSCKVARDNTVKYRWHTLQLLPEPGHPSYVGTSVEIQVRLDGSLVVFHQGRMIPTREAPPRPGVLRAGNRIWCSGLTILPKSLTENFVCETAPRNFHTRKSSTTSDSPDHQPTAQQQARWEAVQAAKRKGMGIRETARELGISRNTVKRNLAAEGPIVYPARQSPKPSTMLPVLRPTHRSLTKSLVANT